MLVLARFTNTGLSDIHAMPVRRIVAYIKEANALAKDIQKAQER
jgi:hypothetical protein